MNVTVHVQSLFDKQKLITHKSKKPKLFQRRVKIKNHSQEKTITNHPAA